MRYSAIGVFRDGGFFTPYDSSRNYSNANIMQGLYDSRHSDKLQEFLKEHKYVIVSIKYLNFMIFEESHPMFNTILLRNKEGINIERQTYKYNQKINYQQEAKLIINRLIVEFGGLNSSLLE
jgi:hypothetical protein